jgi:hypothetical protein
MDAASKSLVETFHDWVVATVDEKGFEVPHALARGADGKLTVYALALGPSEAYRLMLSTWERDEPLELIFALDRFAKPGQGTELGDLLAGFHLTRKAPRPFIIEYQYAPRIVKPIDWGNAWWNATLQGEMISTLRGHLGLGARP